MNVLCVTVDSTDLDSVSAHLSRELESAAVLPAASFAEAVRILDREPIDCVVGIDERTDGSGLELVTSVCEVAPDVPFVLVSKSGAAAEAIDAGASDCVVGPAGPDRRAVLANRVETIVARRRAESTVERRVRQQELVADLGRTTLDADRPSAVADAVECIAEGLGVEHATALEHRFERDELRPVAAVGWSAGAIEDACVNADSETVAGTALRSGEPAIVADLPAAERVAGPSSIDDATAAIGVPVGDPEAPWGGLAAYATERERIRDEDVAFVRNVATVLACAIDRASRPETEDDRWFYQIAENSNNIIWLMDAQFTEMHYINPVYEEIWGYPREVLYEDPLSYLEHFHPEDRSEEREWIETMRGWAETGDAPDVIRDEIRFYDSDGELHWFSEITFPIRQDGEIVRWAGIDTDVTDRKRNELELERQNEQLSEFADIVGHDLRNPLSILEGSLEFAAETGDAEHFENCRHAVDRMNALIDDLLTLARTRRPVDELLSVPLARLAKSCWRTVDTKGARLQVRTDREVRVSESRTRQLLENLFRNAVEHAGPDVTVTVGDLADGFYVEDDGSGVPKRERDAVFESGYSTASDGTGFGLKIVDQVARSHGWEVRLTEGDAGGARFEFEGVNSG